MGAGGAGKGLRTTLVRWQQWEKIGELSRPATCLASQCFASQKWQVASIRPNDSGRSDFEQGRHTIDDRGRSRAGTSKKTEVTEERADEPGGALSDCGRCETDERCDDEMRERGWR